MICLFDHDDVGDGVMVLVLLFAVFFGRLHERPLPLKGGALTICSHPLPISQSKSLF